MNGQSSEAPEMAEELERLGYYHPTPAHDMWAFGLLLLELVGGCRPQAHVDACLTMNPERTRAYSSSLLHMDPGLEYYDKVSSPACKPGRSLLAFAMMAI